MSRGNFLSKAIAFLSLKHLLFSVGNLKEYKLMKLDSRNSVVNLPPYLHPLNWLTKSEISTTEDLQASTWVQLRERPTPYSHDEALLLCKHSDTEWIVWIPEHGEMVLHRSQFSKAC